MNTIRGYVLTTAISLSAACASPVDDHGLAAARDRWTQHAAASYSFVWQRDCDCPPELTRSIQISVTSGQITGAVYVDDRSPVAANLRASLLTIDGVFDKIQMAIDQRPAQVDLRFDPALGYPTSVFVDYSHQIADEELALQISGLTSTAAE